MAALAWLASSKAAASSSQHAVMVAAQTAVPPDLIRSTDEVNQSTSLHSASQLAQYPAVHRHQGRPSGVQSVGIASGNSPLRCKAQCAMSVLHSDPLASTLLGRQADVPAIADGNRPHAVASTMTESMSVTELSGKVTDAKASRGHSPAEEERWSVASATAKSDFQPRPSETPTNMHGASPGVGIRRVPYDCE